MKRIKTTLLLGMVGFLLVATLYISMQLQQEQSPSSPTTIRQTKASSVTYRRTVDVNAAATPTEVITPALSQSPEISLSPTISLTPPAGSITGTLLAQATSPTPTPTEIILAKANLSTTLSATNSATVSANQKTKALPQSGWAQMTTLLFITASAFILFSFIF